MKRKSLLDSFAVLAWIQDEQEAQVVENLLYGAQRGEGQVIMNIVNLGEVFSIAARESRPSNLPAKFWTESGYCPSGQFRAPTTSSSMAQK